MFVQMSQQMFAAPFTLKGCWFHPELWTMRSLGDGVEGKEGIPSTIGSLQWENRK